MIPGGEGGPPPRPKGALARRGSTRRRPTDTARRTSTVPRRRWRLTRRGGRGRPSAQGGNAGGHMHRGLMAKGRAKLVIVFPCVSPLVLNPSLSFYHQEHLFHDYIQKPHPFILSL